MMGHSGVQLGVDTVDERLPRFEFQPCHSLACDVG